MALFGFAILSHRQPAQVARLIGALNALYDRPPIACHHDASQSVLDTSGFPPNVRFVTPSRPTAWGKWAVVEAMLATLECLHAQADPDYTFLVSGADYPTTTPAQTLTDLQSSGADAWIDHFDLKAALKNGVEPVDAHLAHHRALHNLKLERDHYLRAQVRVPIIRFRPPAYSSTRERYPRLGRLTFALPFDAPSSPFHANYRCFAGGQWFTASRKAARKLLSPSCDDLRLREYYRSRVIPDESYVQTVLCNDPDLAVDSRTFRYALWDGAHPVDLGLAHYDLIRERRAHFSRKFSEGDPVLDRIDADLGIASAGDAMSVRSQAAK